MTTYTCPEGHSSSDGDYCDVCGSPIGGSSAATPAASDADASDAGASGVDAPAPASELDLDTPPPMPDVAVAAPAGQVCPNCSATGLPGALFCENCGYDFTTGQMPRPLEPPEPAGAGSSDAGAVVQPPPSAPAPSSGQAPSSGAGTGTVEWVVEIWVDPDWHAAQDVDEACPSPGMPVVVPLRERSVLIGRTSVSRNIHPEVEVVGDTGVSRRHAQLTNDGRRWWVEDLQSANGTYLGAAGAPLPMQPIVPGQKSELPDDGRIYLGAWTRLVVRKALPSEV